MNLLPRWLILWLHTFIVLAFIYTHSYSYLQMTIVLFLHIFVLINDSSCSPGHCRYPSGTGPFQLQRDCCKQQTCKAIKWMRMKHCYKCQRCIHKYDHHCVLMDICIGEFNHKYYLLFLISLVYNTVVMVIIFTFQMKEEVEINLEGLQTFSVKYYLYGLSLIALYFNLILNSYLTFHHIYFVCNNTTTWEFYKRDAITYLKNIDRDIKHPFSIGLCNNFIQLLEADRDHPFNWERQLQVSAPHQHF